MIRVASGANIGGSRQTGRVSQGSHAWVLHVDLDQFIAAVEVLRHPELAGKPVIVGGRGDPTERAVVSTASYEARVFGVGSGMPLRIAARKAPEAVILPVDHEAYIAASEEVMATLRAQPGAVVQVLGWDEAFVGVQTDDPEAYAGALQRAVLERTRLHCSVGIGDTLVRAKVATGFGKPQGVFRLTAENWLEVMGDRPTIDLWGVGTKISRRLAALGITTVAELAAASTSTTDSSPSSARGWAPGTRSSDAATAPGSSTTPRGWHAATAARPPTSRTSPSASQIEDAIRELAAQVLADVAAEGRPVVGLDAQGALRAVHHEDVHEEGGRDVRPRAVVLARVMELVGADRARPTHSAARLAGRDEHARGRSRGAHADAQRVVSRRMTRRLVLGGRAVRACGFAYARAPFVIFT